MTKDYSLDLRRRITDVIAGGLSCRQAAKQFAVSASTAIRYQQRLQRTGSLEPDLRGRSRRGKLSPYRERIIGKVEAQPDITMSDLSIWLHEQTGIKVHPSNFSRLLCKSGYTYKKHLLASEQERSDVKLEREEWKQYRLPRINCIIGKVVFIDETCTKTNMTPLRGRALKGKRLIAHAPSGKWQTTTFIAGLRSNALTAPFVIKGAMDGAAFETYVKTQLAPTLRKGDVVVCDNLNVHKSKIARQMIEDKGARLLFLPRYSPDLNPIEKAFSKLKTLLRKAKARDYEALWKTIGNICDLFPPQQCLNYFKSCGYEPV